MKTSHQSLLLGFHSTHRRRTNITPSGRRRAINDQIFANEGRNYGNLRRRRKNSNFRCHFLAYFGQLLHCRHGMAKPLMSLSMWGVKR
ncbi:hypothetical protein ES332_A02G147100v1 [Gossypium tomentosum]|uniref:Uncharacterized protein n=1 Tax=Gossypium tomentosum TaxID=34277 RepID=A0A5D2RK95_GOSTO|nr:hypothetical protein ES332_A02G147100v1 [Gossypium tomentosum]